MHLLGRPVLGTSYKTRGRVGGERRAIRLRHLAVATLLAAASLVAGCGSGGDPPLAQARAAISDLDSPMTRLSDAIDAARPTKRATMVSLQASADRTSAALRNTLGEVRDLADSASGDDRRRLSDISDALTDVRSFTDSLASSRPAAAQLQVDSERAQQAIDDAGLDFPPLSADTLVAALRRARADSGEVAQGPIPTPGPGVSAPVGPDPAASASAASTTSYFNYSGPAFQARLPEGEGWGSPAQSQPTPGRLFRTSVRGPDGLFVIIDYTPFETAKFGGHYTSRTEVGQTAFGSATRYVFQGGSLPECQRSTCVDYIINDTSNGSGFGVLAGGPSFEAAAALAQTVAESVVPSQDGE